MISAPVTKWQVIAGNQAKTPKATRKQGKAIKPPIGQFAGLNNQTNQCDTAQSIHRYCGPPAAWVLSYIVLSPHNGTLAAHLQKRQRKAALSFPFYPKVKLIVALYGTAPAPWSCFHATTSDSQYHRSSLWYHQTSPPDSKTLNFRSNSFRRTTSLSGLTWPICMNSICTSAQQKNMHK